LTGVLGSILLQKMMRYCKHRGTAQLLGETLADNYRMLNLARDLGFNMLPLPDSKTVRLGLDLSLRK
jgi:acetyltransferase